MAKDNILGPVSQAAQNLRQSSHSLSQQPEFDDSFNNLTDASFSKNLEKQRRAINEAKESSVNLFRESQKQYLEQEKSERLRIANTAKLVRLETDRFTTVSKRLEQDKLSGKLGTAARQDLEIQVKKSKELITIGEFSLKISQRELDITRRNRQENVSHFQNVVLQSKRAARDLDVLENQRSKSFSSHFLNPRNNLNVLSAARTYGRAKFSSNLKSIVDGDGEGSAMDMMGGATALIGGYVLSKMVSKIGQVFKRNIDTAIIQGDAAKGGAAVGESSQTFRRSIMDSMRGFGTSFEEDAAISHMIRPIMGKAGAAGQFADVMRGGTVLDRAMGSDLGTGSQFIASMVRKSDLGTGAGELNKFTAGIAEAIGRGRLTGLQEETMQGIQELVQLTRRSVLNGPSAGIFAGMIADVSGLGAKSLKGADAASAIAGISQGLSNPTSGYGSIISMMSLRNVLKTNFPGRKFSDGELLMKQQQGAGLEVDGKSLGAKYIAEALRISSKFSVDPAMNALAFANFANISPQAAGLLQKNYSVLGGSQSDDFHKAFGLGDLSKNFTNTGTATFLGNLGEQYSRSKIANPDADQVKAMITATEAEMAKNLTPKQQQELAAVDKNTANSTVAEKVNAILQFSAKVSNATPEDEIRNLTKSIDRNIGSLTNYGLDYLSKIVDYLMPNKGYGEAKEAERKAAEESDAVAEQRRIFERIAAANKEHLKNGEPLEKIPLSAEQLNSQRLANEQSRRDSDDTDPFPHVFMEAGSATISANKSINDRAWKRLGRIGSMDTNASGLDRLAMAITNSEGKSGNLNYRLNNPGLLEFRGQPGAIKNGRFAQFDSFSQGFDALKADIDGKSRKNPDLTIQQLAMTWLGHTYPHADKEGDSVAKAKFIAEQVGAKVDTRLGDVMDNSKTGPPRTASQLAADKAAESRHVLDHRIILQTQDSAGIVQEKQKSSFETELTGQTNRAATTYMEY